MDLSVSLPGMDLKNPIMPASGCFGYGRKYSEHYDLSKLGAIIMKAATASERKGNPTPRIAETDAGMLNAIGLKNPGVENIVHEEVPFLAKYHVPILANIAGSTITEYVHVARAFNHTPYISALELNISCPNVESGGVQFGTDPDAAFEITRAVKEVSERPVYVKLSPNVTDIVAIAEAVEEAGADGLSMINTLTGMRLHVENGKPFLGNHTGGLSGRAIKPLAIRMIYDVYRHVSIPIIGMGGISCADDVLEFLMAGASAVAIGTAHFQNPTVCPDIIDDLPHTLNKYGFASFQDVVGKGHEDYDAVVHCP